MERLVFLEAESQLARGASGFLLLKLGLSLFAHTLKKPQFLCENGFTLPSGSFEFLRAFSVLLSRPLEPCFQLFGGVRLVPSAPTAEANAVHDVHELSQYPGPAASFTILFHTNITTQRLKTLALIPFFGVMKGMTKIQWKTYKNYAGPKISGIADFSPPTGDREPYHVDRAFWLTSKVETGARFGAVMAYDGTAMTAGLDQHVAVYPRELSRPDDGNALDDQGTLWKLLRCIEVVPFGPHYGQGSGSLMEVRENLWNSFSATGWYLAQDGVLRYYHTGLPVNGHEIRDEFTPRRGKPTTKFQREEAKHWAKLFHDLFAHPATHKAQIEYGKEHLVKRTNRRKLNVQTIRYLKLEYLKVSDFYPQEITSLKLNSNWNVEQDLAMCMYQSHSVNAPSIANKALIKVLDKKKGKLRKDWPKRLIHILGNSKYGRWDDDLKYGRYQRTRSAARGSGLWPTRLFDGPNAIMPKDLSG